jgi:hypothetical protein
VAGGTSERRADCASSRWTCLRLCPPRRYSGAEPTLAPPPWYTGAKLEEDPFGKAMLDCGIPKETILSWTKDPQVGMHCEPSRGGPMLCERTCFSDPAGKCGALETR